jgi:hypothetical protein
MDYLFQDTSVEDAPPIEPIGEWDTSAAESMVGLFQGMRAFDQPIVKWRTGKVQDMSGMFEDAASFDQKTRRLGRLESDKMTSMFSGTTAINQQIGKWNGKSRALLLAGGPRFANLLPSLQSRR